jgi:hypothetical protein
MNVTNKFLALFFCLFMASNVLGKNILIHSSKCIFPYSDGGNSDVASRANIHGKIIRKTNSTIIIREKNNKETVIVFNKKTKLYTVFGGDFSLDVLSTGLEAWVWFKNCKKPSNKMPLAVLIWIFSTDPNDLNPEWNADKENWPSPSSKK